MKAVLKSTFKIPFNKTNLDRAVQASATQHEGELIVQVDSLKREQKLVAKLTHFKLSSVMCHKHIYLNSIMLHSKPRYEGSSLRE